MRSLNCDGFSHDYLSYFFVDVGGVVVVAVAFCSFQHYSFYSFVLLFIEVIFFSSVFRIFTFVVALVQRH